VQVELFVLVPHGPRLIFVVSLELFTVFNRLGV